MKKVCGYCLDEKLIKKITALAKKRRVSASWLVNESIIYYLNKEEENEKQNKRKSIREIN